MSVEWNKAGGVAGRVSSSIIMRRGRVTISNMPSQQDMQLLLGTCKLLRRKRDWSYDMEISFSFVWVTQTGITMHLSRRDSMEPLSMSISEWRAVLNASNGCGMITLPLLPATALPSRPSSSKYAL